MEQKITLKVPFKTRKEKDLNDLYMRWLSSDEIVPNAVVNRFKNDVEQIRKDNPIYNGKIF